VLTTKDVNAKDEIPIPFLFASFKVQHLLASILNRFYANSNQACFGQHFLRQLMPENLGAFYG
jgi:hypothetical protein